MRVFSLSIITLALLLNSLTGFSQHSFQSASENTSVENDFTDLDKNKEKMFKSVYLRFSLLMPGINIEKPILDNTHCFGIQYSLKPTLFFSFSTVNNYEIGYDLFPLEIYYKYYYNLEKRIRTGKKYKNHNANFLKYKAETLFNYKFSRNEYALNRAYGSGLLWGGNFIFNMFYINYEIGPMIYFSDNRILFFLDNSLPFNLQSKISLGIFF